jgi:hypothetical protein
MKMPSFSIKTLGIAVAVLLILLAGGYLLWQGLENGPEEAQEDLGPLGALGSVCGGEARLPCNPGLVCDLQGGRPGIDRGRCVKDERVPAEQMGEGEPCDKLLHLCGPGLACQIPEGAEEGTCEMVFFSDGPFIMSVVPEGMDLVGGSYQAPPGTEVTVHVNAVNVDMGDLYLKPLSASHAGVLPDEKVSELERQGDSNEFLGSFTVDRDLGASLVALMYGEDGQEVQVSINVASSLMRSE